MHGVLVERFTEPGRQVVVLAQEEARTCRHGDVGTEHILLGLLLQEEGLAARVLNSLDITEQRVRDDLLRMVGSREEVLSGDVAFSPEAKKVIELALAEALYLGHNKIATEHILLALIGANEGLGACILSDFGADDETIRNVLAEQLYSPSGHR